MISALVFIIAIASIAYLNNQQLKQLKEAEQRTKSQRDLQWRAYIQSFVSKATNEESAGLLKSLLDHEPDSVTVDAIKSENITEAGSTATTSTADTGQTYTTAPSPVAPIPNQAEAKSKIYIDNAMLLLYFGAFLFVVSAGLFAVLGGINGTLRTLVIFFVMALMYGTGIRLHSTSRRFKQAGIAFTAIGMAIAPLVGLAAYSYITNKSNGAAVWFMTSIVTLVMYCYALYRIRYPFLGYLLIFSFVSLFMSAVSLFDVPIYYFAWAAIVASLLLQFISVSKNLWPELTMSSGNVSKILVPLTLLGSVLVAGEQGFAQMAVSLLLSSAFYYVEGTTVQHSKRANWLFISHVLFLLALSFGAFSFDQSISSVAVALFIIGLLHIFTVLVTNPNSLVVRNLASVAIAASAIATIAAAGKPKLAVVILAEMVILSGVVAFRQRRFEAYVVGGLAMIFLPVVAGFFAIEQASDGVRAALAVASPGVLMLSRFAIARSKANRQWLAQSEAVYLMAVLGAIFVTFFGSIGPVIIVALILSASQVLLGVSEKQPMWYSSSGFTIALPIYAAFTGRTEVWIPFSVVIALCWNIAVSLQKKQDANRWLSAGLWLLLPFALYNSDTFMVWSIAALAWAYVAVMLCLIFSRLLALGKLSISGKALMMSYTSKASISYVYGYITSGVISLMLSLFSENSKLHTSIILLLLILTTALVSLFAERKPKTFFLVPLLVQGLILNIVRPITLLEGGELWLVISIVSALAFYLLSHSSKDKDFEVAFYAIRLASIVTSFFAPLSILFFQESSVLMPVGLAIAGGMLYYENANKDEPARELSTAIMFMSILWLVYFAGIRQVQAYTHIVAVMFAFFAYWRWRLNDATSSDQYIKVCYAVITLPLILQALAGDSASLYGIWLLVEEAFIVFIGLALQRRFLTLGGLYVAVGAVLYQLRSLGWAFVLVLALFVIGMAIYWLNRADSADKAIVQESKK